MIEMAQSDELATRGCLFLKKGNGAAMVFLGQTGFRPLVARTTLLA